MDNLQRTSLIDEMVRTVMQAHADSYTKMFPMKSLYMCEHRRSFKVGDQVVIENEKMVKQNDEVPTHEITLLEGTLADTRHSITLRNLSTNEPLKIDL